MMSCCRACVKSCLYTVQEYFGLPLFHHFSWHLNCRRAVSVVVVVVMVVPVCVIVFQELNFLVVIAASVFGFTACLELFVMAWVAVDTLSSIVNCVMLVGIMGFSVFPASCGVWVFFCGFLSGEFIGVLCSSTTVLGVFLINFAICLVNLAWAFFVCEAPLVSEVGRGVKYVSMVGVVV